MTYRQRNEIEATVNTSMKTADTHQPSIMGFGGSPRRGGNTDILLATILRAAEEQGSSVESVQLRDMQFKGCIGCEKCRKDRVCTGLKDGMTPLYPKILDSQWARADFSHAQLQHHRLDEGVHRPAVLLLHL